MRYKSCVLTHTKLNHQNFYKSFELCDIRIFYYSFLILLLSEKNITLHPIYVPFYTHYYYYTYYTILLGDYLSYKILIRFLAILRSSFVALLKLHTILFAVCAQSLI